MDQISIRLELHIPDWTPEEYLESWKRATTNYAKTAIGTFLPPESRLFVNGEEVK